MATRPQKFDPSLIAQLLALIPGLIQDLMKLVDTIGQHPDTPEAAKAQLDDISQRLDEAAAKVAAVRV